MASFAYTAINGTGLESTGEITAPDVGAADYEIVRVTAGAGGSTWTVTRGVDGTTRSRTTRECRRRSSSAWT
jgi:hypothetical protein